MRWSQRRAVKEENKLETVSRPGTWAQCPGEERAVENPGQLVILQFWGRASQPWLYIRFTWGAFTNTAAQPHPRLIRSEALVLGSRPQYLFKFLGQSRVLSGRLVASCPRGSLVPLHRWS